MDIINYAEFYFNQVMGFGSVGSSFWQWWVRSCCYV